MFVTNVEGNNLLLTIGHSESVALCIIFSIKLQQHSNKNPFKHRLLYYYNFFLNNTY